jgi:glycine amidinotransferase
MRRHYPEHRIHTMSFGEAEPQHIETTWVPLRPGLVLHWPGRPADPRQVKELERNGLEVVEAVSPQRPENVRLSYCSIWLSMNLLVLDPNTVCVEASEGPQMEQLDSLGFDVIPIPFWDVAPFGGGLHCATADVYREGTREDYFPKGLNLN